MKAHHRACLGRGAQLACAAAAVALFEACSLIGLGDFDLETCSEAAINGRSRCEVLDSRDGIPDDACLHWQCRRSGPGCELRAKDYDDDGHADLRVCGGEPAVESANDCDDENGFRHKDYDELPDGLDNDCDGVIDDGVLERTLRERGVVRTAFDPTRGALDMQLMSSLESTRPLIGLTSNGRGLLFDPMGESQTPIEFDSAAAIGLPTPKPCPTLEGHKACNTRQLALTATRQFIVAASVSDDSQCPLGELRLGLGDPSAPPLRFWLGHNSRTTESSIQYGVDVRRQEGCSPRSGARAPTVASQTIGGATNALAAWLDESVAATRTCDSQDERIAVRAIGVWAVPSNRAFLRATNDGASQVLGHTSGSAPPALLAIPGEAGGYIAAYGNAGGELEIVRIAALPVGGSEVEGTPPLRPPAVQTFTAGPHVDRVELALAAHRGSAAETRLGVAFRTGCGETARVGFYSLGSEASAAFGTGPLVTLTNTEVSGPTEVLDGPTLVAVESGFKVGADGEANQGGWLIAWTARIQGKASLLAVRVSSDGELLDDAPVVLTGQDSDRALIYPGEFGCVSYATVNEATAALAYGTMLCTSD